MDHSQLSVILPVLDEGARLPRLLTELAPLRALGAELIAVDGGSGDGSRELLAAEADVLLDSERGRARQMNRGAGAASGQWLLFLHADSVLPARPEAWLTELGQTCRHWGFFPVRLSGGSPLLRWVERGINLRSRLSRVATGDQGLFVRRAVFERLGGFADIPLMEDVDISKRLRRVGRPLIWSAPMETSSRRWERHGILRTVLLMWWLRFLYFGGVSPHRLVERYYPGATGEAGDG